MSGSVVAGMCVCGAWDSSMCMSRGISVVRVIRPHEFPADTVLTGSTCRTCRIKSASLEKKVAVRVAERAFTRRKNVWQTQIWQKIWRKSCREDAALRKVGYRKPAQPTACMGTNPATSKVVSMRVLIDWPVPTLQKCMSPLKRPLSWPAGSEDWYSIIQCWCRVNTSGWVHKHSQPYEPYMLPKGP